MGPDLLRVGILAAALVAALGFGLWRRRGDGRARDVERGVVLAPQDLGADLGEHATLLQISTTFCQPCRTARRVLCGVAEVVPGVVHVEIDAEENMDLVRRLDVVRTPTVLVLDASGRVVQRTSGVPARSQVLDALRRHLPHAVPHAGGPSMGASGAA